MLPAFRPRITYRLSRPYSHSAVLVMILRLRQLCCHPNLILVSKLSFLVFYLLI
jgi:hypothetical protein